MKKNDIQGITAQICGDLTKLGCEYHFEADNRSNRRSAYIYVRKPVCVEIRVSDHPSQRKARDKQLDVGPHGISAKKAVDTVAELLLDVFGAGHSGIRRTSLNH